MWGRRRHPSYQDAVLLALVMSLLLQAQQAHVHVRAPVTLALVAGACAGGGALRAARITVCLCVCAMPRPSTPSLARPITRLHSCCTLAGQVAIYLRKFLPLGLARLIPSVDAGCLHPASIVRVRTCVRMHQPKACGREPA